MDDSGSIPAGFDMKFHDTNDNGWTGVPPFITPDDSNNGSIYGQNIIAPKDEITRAEVAVIVRRLLQKSNLI